MLIIIHSYCVGSCILIENKLHGEHNSVQIQLPARTYEINYFHALIDLKLQSPSSNHEINIVSYTIDREGGCGTEIAKRI